MTINFFEPGSIPRPRHEIKIERFEANVYPDRRRVRITLHLTPFLERPCLALALVKDERQLAGEMSVIETMHNKMEFTLHVRSQDDPAGDYLLKARLYYEDFELIEEEGKDPIERMVPDVIEQQEIPLTIPAESEMLADADHE